MKADEIDRRQRLRPYYELQRAAEGGAIIATGIPADSVNEVTHRETRRRERYPAVGYSHRPYGTIAVMKRRDESLTYRGRAKREQRHCDIP